MPLAHATTDLQLVTCQVGPETYGIDILCVQETIRPVSHTPVPKVDPAVTGVINLRGRIIPVLDLRRCFTVEATPLTGSARIIVVRSQHRLVGLLVDAIAQVHQLTRDQVEPPPTMGLNAGLEYISGVGRLKEHLIRVLDVPVLLSAHLQGFRESPLA